MGKDNPFEAAEKEPQKLKTELGFVVDAAEVRRLEQGLRGNYDASRIQRDHPQLVDLITWLLSLPGMTHKAIAEAAGISWETVAGIAALNKEPIRQFKLRLANKLGLVLDAAVGGLMAKAAAGELSALDFKVLSDAWLQMSGEGHTVRFEGTSEDPQRAAFRRFLEGSRTVLEGEIISSKGVDAGATHALPAEGGRIPLNAPVTDSLSVPLYAQPVDDQDSKNLLVSELVNNTGNEGHSGVVLAGMVESPADFQNGGGGGPACAGLPLIESNSAGEIFRQWAPEKQPQKKEGAALPHEPFGPKP